VPVCLNCGKAIEPGGKYCDECGPPNAGKVPPLAELSARAARPPSRGYNRMVLVTMLCLAVLMVAIAVGLVLSIPSGPAYMKKAQAAVCRSHQRDVQQAIDSYKSANGKLPPTGRVSADNPLIIDRYLESPPECPSTHHYYIVESEDGTETVRCDSGLAGHKI
jgi:hypothetical protein